MTTDQISRAKALGHCTFLPGSSEKRFVRDMERAAFNSPETKTLTSKQHDYLVLLCWKYRNQLTKHGFAQLVPATKPGQPKSLREPS
jgi:hypothetical protein